MLIINNQMNKCKNIYITIMFFLSLLIKSSFFVSAEQNSFEVPMPTDTRIKTFIYNPNEIFQVKFMIGYQSMIELQKDEEIEMTTCGYPAGWDIKVIDNVIFLKAKEPGIKTSFTIKTNKRMYMMEIMSNGDDDDYDERITYLLRFFYPDINVDIPPTTTKLAKIALNKRIAANTRNTKTVASGVIANAGSLNTNYTYSNKGDTDKIMPKMVFDNGSKTYFKFETNEDLPKINAVTDDYQEIPLRIKRNGDYVYVDTVEKQLTIRKDENTVVCIFNESIKNKTSVAFVNGN